MKSLIIVLSLLAFSNLSFGQACPNGKCPPDVSKKYGIENLNIPIEAMPEINPHYLERKFNFPYQDCVSSLFEKAYYLLSGQDIYRAKKLEKDITGTYSHESDKLDLRYGEGSLQLSLNPFCLNLTSDEGLSQLQGAIDGIVTLIKGQTSLYY